MNWTIVFILAASALSAQEFGSIQAAIDAASDGDEIRVPPGVYREAIDFKGKSLTITAWDPEKNAPGNPWDHVISAPAPGRSVVSMSSPIVQPGGGPVPMVLEGFTVRDGEASKGAGVMIGGNVFAELYRCLITHNRALDSGGAGEGGSGGGVFMDGAAQATILSCAVVSNSAPTAGGAIYVEGPPVDQPRTGGISIVNCTVTGNRSTRAAVCFQRETGAVCIYNNIIWDNEGGDIESAEPILSSCNLLGAATGIVCDSCVTGDPLFSDSDLATFRLRRDSPARDRGCDASACLRRPFGRPSVYTDINGHPWVGDPDMGVDEYFEIFVRADVNQNSDPGEIGDAISILTYLFANGPCLCEDAADANDDGTLDLADGVYILVYCFRQGPYPPPPFPDPGEDPTEDSLDCRYYEPGTSPSPP